MKIIIRVALVLVGLAVILVAGLLTYVFAFLPNVPLEEVRIEYTHERIKRGEYLSRHVAQCSACHSERDWSRFSGPFKPGTEGSGGERYDRPLGFPGSYPASNITPHNLQDWSDAELLRAITGGVNRDGRPMFPVMPYPNYARLDREDIYSIIAYIRSLPPVKHDVPAAETDFPMSIFIRLIPSAPEFSERPSRTDKVAYGKYVATAASCAECHTPAERGRIIEEKLYSGGRFIQLEWGSVEASNITPDKETGIGAWTEMDFIQRFKAFDKASGKYENDAVEKGAFNTPMPWQGYAGMSEEDLAAIYAYLMTVKPLKNRVVKGKVVR
ncbi:MAG TPA: c-type cytochrome [Aridibacter sp.]|nr:c-type cytochrome [Aridibacter sp.]